MNLRQLKTLCEIVDRGLRITEAAHATHRSQPSVTRQIQLLEKELGAELFVRKGNKLLRITPHGQDIVAIARGMLHDAENMMRIGRNAAGDESGAFTIATTNFQAKYVLAAAVREFVTRFPEVSLSLRQGTPAECCDLVSNGKADLAVCAVSDVPEGLVAVPCYRLYRSVMTPPRHPLLKTKRLRLETLAAYPLITYDEGFGGSWIVNRTFEERGLSPNIILSVVDADVAKIYVGMGLGIAIAATVAFDEKQDINLRRIDARHLFKPSDASVVARRHAHLRSYMIEFVQIFAPHVARTDLEEAVFRKQTATVQRTVIPEL